MNRLYTLASLALVAGSLSAQRPGLNSQAPKLSVANGHSNAPVPAHSATGAQRDVIFSDDFSNGLAGNNGVGAWTVSGANGNIWKMTTSAPRGAYSGATVAIMTAARLGRDAGAAPNTGDNGLMLFNGDSANCTWNNGVPTAFAEEDFVNWNGALESPVLDLSANPYVLLQFNERFRYCCGSAPMFVQVSTDGGTSWPTTLDCSEGIAANTLSATMLVSINISAAIAANPANVKFRFFHDGASSATSHYHWQLDDVALVTASDHDVQLINGASYEWTSAAATYDSLDYTIIPTSQLTVMPLNMRIFNNGASEETNVTAHFNVTDAANTSVYSNDVNVGSVPAGDSLTINADSPFTPPATIGTYKIHFSLTSDATDSNTGNNADSTNVTVSANDYARDDNAMDGSLGITGAGTTTDAATIGNGFHVVNDATLYAVDVAIATGADEGTTVLAEVRDAADLDNGLLVQSEEYQIVPGDLTDDGGNHMIHFILTEPLDVTANSDYFVGLKHFGGALVRVCSSGESPDQTSFLYGNGGTAGVDWYFITSTPMVRMNFDSNVGIEESDVQNGVGLGQNFPNPVANITTIPYSLTTAAKVTMDIYDVSGKVVRTISEGNKAAGAYRINLSTYDMQQGVYFYTLTAGDARMTKRMTVVH